MRTPPLNAVRMFESAGRCLSFTLAANELNVTPGAVSRQIRLLEDFLGIQLFVRANREVSLTVEGSIYLESLIEAFAQISAATEQIMEVPEDQPLRVSSSLTFVLRWLMPRLISYHSLQPSRNLQLTTSIEPVDFRRDSLDAVIRLGHSDTPHSMVKTLFRPDLIPVCNVDLYNHPVHPIRSIEDLRHHTLLHTSARPQNWETWLKAVGNPDLGNVKHLYFESSSLAYQAAVDGVGIAVGQVSLLVEELKSGKLKTPFPISTPDADEYNVIWPSNASRNKTLMQFINWIAAESEATVIQARDIVNSLK